MGVEVIVGVTLAFALLAVLFGITRRRSKRFQFPPSGGWGFPGRSGDREPRHPLVPAGSAAATVEDLNSSP